jgi:REP element-mobilizing transposase RayT
MPDHVHLLVNLPPTLAPATFIGQVKGAVSHEYHSQFGVHDYVKWQEGYGVVSMRKNDIVKAIAYITNQEAIHAARKISVLMEKIDTDGW